MLAKLNGRELITEQTFYEDISRRDPNHNSTHVIIIKGRTTLDKHAQTFASASRKCINENAATG